MRSGRKRKQVIYSRQNKVQLLRGGKPYFDCLMQMIANAKDSIHLQTYIYMDDERGRQVADALKAAVNRQVTVHLLVDGYASKSLSRQFIEVVKKAGIHCRFFEPIF